MHIRGTIHAGILTLLAVLLIFMDPTGAAAEGGGRDPTPGRGGSE